MATPQAATTAPYTPPAGVTLDMSASVPVNAATSQTSSAQPSAQPYTPPQGVTLDMSKSVPVTPPASTQTQPAPDYLTKTEDFIHNTAQGVGEGLVKDVWPAVKNMVPGGPAETAAIKGIWSQLPPVQLANATKQVLPLIDTYEKSRASGASVGDSIRAADTVARQHDANLDMAKRAVDAFRANPTKETARGLTDVAAVAAATFGAPELTAEAAPEEATTAARMATAESKPSLLPNPFRKFTGSDIQPTLKKGIRDVWNQTADDAGVPHPTLTTAPSIRDAGQQVGDAILARSKANYKLIDDATGGRFSGTEQALKSVNQDLRSVTNDAQEQELMTRKTRLEMQMNQMMDEAETKGVPKSAVDAAKADFKKAQAVYDTNHQIRMSTTGVRPDMPGATDAPEEVNPKTLLNRTNKLYDSGRMQQAIGDDGSADLIGHSAKAIKMAKNVARNQKIAGAAAGLGGLGGIEAVRHLIP